MILQCLGVMSCTERQYMGEIKQLIVTGFHRSGTSMTMQALARAGVHVGNSLIGADPSNADGHFEDIETVRLHDKWLTEHDTDWCHGGPALEVCEQDAKKQIGQIQRRLDASAKASSAPAWGIKDPRAALFLSQWFQHLQNPYGVFVYRHFASCLKSLQRRQATELLLNPSTSPDSIRFWSAPETALDSWLTHNKALIEVVKQYPDRCVLLSQEAQIAGTRIAEIVKDNLAISLNSISHSGVDETKSVRIKEIQLTDSGIQDDLISTWDTLQSLSVAPCTSTPSIQWSDSSRTDSNLGESGEHTEGLDDLNQQWDELGIEHAA